MPDTLAQAALSSSSREKFQTLGRIGYATKGVVYFVVGLLAARTAFGLGGGGTTGTKGAVLEIGAQPFGRVLMIVIAVGLFAYALWRFYQVWKAPALFGGDASRVATRIGRVISGVVHLSLGWFAAAVALGGGSGGGGDDTPGFAAELMAQPYGRWLVGLAGVAVAGFGIRQFLRAKRASFMDDYGHRPMSARQREVAKAAGRVGLSARGVVFVMIGVFAVVAAVNANPDEARGLGGALRTLLQQDQGPLLLGIVAIGLIAYALHCFFNARYRRCAS